MATVQITCAKCGSTRSDERLMERFWSRVDTSEECWPWTGSISPNGYGRLTVGRHPAYAHRVSYELNVGPIPEGLQIDHLCWNRRCVRPSHLRAVTNAVNTANRRPREDGTSPSLGRSGVRGVAWISHKQKWRVALPVSDGRRIWGGYFTDLEDARLACAQLAERIANGAA